MIMLPGAQAAKPSGALSLLLVMITRVPDSRDGLPGGGLIAGCIASRHIREKDPGRSSHDARGADSALPAVPAESAGGRAAGSAEGGECRANVVRVHAGGVVRRHVPGPDDAGTVDDEGGGDGQVPAAVGGVGG